MDNIKLNNIKISNRAFEQFEKLTTNENSNDMKSFLEHTVRVLETFSENDLNYNNNVRKLKKFNGGKNKIYIFVYKKFRVLFLINKEAEEKKEIVILSIMNRYSRKNISDDVIDDVIKEYLK